MFKTTRYFLYTLQVGSCTLLQILHYCALAYYTKAYSTVICDVFNTYMLLPYTFFKHMLITYFEHHPYLSSCLVISFSIKISLVAWLNKVRLLKRDCSNMGQCYTSFYSWAHPATVLDTNRHFQPSLIFASKPVEWSTLKGNKLQE